MSNQDKKIKNKNNILTKVIGFFMVSVMMRDILFKIPEVKQLPPALSYTVVVIVSLLLLLGFVLLIEKISLLIQSCSMRKTLKVLLCMNISALCGGILGIPLSMLPGNWGHYLPLAGRVFLFICNNLFFRYKSAELGDFINRLTNGKFKISEIATRNKNIVLLDTSVIIDSRIADIAHSGFIPGKLVIPGFVLQELQFIADSDDAQRRQRGRRGLDTLAAMQKDSAIQVEIQNFELPNVREVDAKLMQLALQLNCPILTNDYNMNKVADLQGIRILNVNDLANAVKSILLPGEKLNIMVIQEGKEINQGVGYMEDGTMVVIENGRCYLNQQIDVVVTKILQTAAGRMIFARHEKDLGVKR